MSVFRYPVGVMVSLDVSLSSIVTLVMHLVVRRCVFSVAVTVARKIEVNYSKDRA